MTFSPLPFRASLQQYRDQAADLLRAWQDGNATAIEFVTHRHPRFLNPDIPWLPKRLSDEEVRRAAFDQADAELAVARGYDFADWRMLEEYVEAVTDDDSAVCRFETTVEAVIHGDVASVQSLLGRHPELAHARSTRVTPFNPPVHRATLLHYVAANGVEGYRQLTPPNAVAIADALLDAGADVDALADMYGGQCTTMSMLVSSTPPARAGVQVPLVETLIDHAAAVEALGSGHWASPLMTALAFGFTDAADALVRRGARVETLAAAAGLGRVLDVRRLLDRADSPECHRALALSAQHGHVEIVRLLLDAGEDPNRYNPEGNHAHSTPLHQAVLAGRVEVVQLLVEHGARLDIKDAIYESTPLGWAVYAGQPGIAEYLRAHGAV